MNPKSTPEALFISSKTIKSIAADHSTPFYLYDERSLLKNVRSVFDCFSWQNRFQNYFPMKENPNPHFLRCLWDAGCGILACGKTELLLALKNGFGGERLMYQPVVRDMSAEQLAADAGVSWLITDPDLLPTCPAELVLLRYFPDITEHPWLKASDLKRVKTGFAKIQLINTLHTLRVRNTPKVGLELQIRSLDIRPNALELKTRTLLSVLEELRARTGVTISVCNIGDGTGFTSHTDLAAASERVRVLLENIPDSLRPEIHTCFGRQLAEDCGLLVSSVRQIKQMQRPMLVLDVSYGQFLRPAFYRADHPMTIIRRTRTKTTPMLYDIVGPLPEEADRLHPGSVTLAAASGDLCVIQNVGCGSRAMPMLNHFQSICPEYLLRTNGSLEAIGAGQTEEEVMEFLTNL